MYDIEDIEKAVDGVDAIICAYGGLPKLHLIRFQCPASPLRAAERAGAYALCRLARPASGERAQHA